LDSVQSNVVFEIVTMITSELMQRLGQLIRWSLVWLIFVHPFFHFISSYHPFIAYTV